MAKWISALVGFACFLGSTAAQAQTFPSRQITLVVTTAAGGTVDLIARSIGQRLSETIGQTVIIENKGGAGHTIGAAYVAKSAPDGYTLMLTEAGVFVSNPHLYPKGKLPYDEEKDFAPISGLALYGHALVAHPSIPVMNVAELIALAKSKPGEINYATSGIGTATHMNVALLENMTGAKLLPVHYRGIAPAMNDVVAGHVKLMSVSASFAVEPAKAGKVKLLGFGTRNRHQQDPDVPTLGESGVPGYEGTSWVGLFAPTGTPTEVVKKLNSAVQSILAEPAMREKLLGPQRLEPMVGTPEQFAAYVKVESGKWLKVIREQNLKID
jgi:tripartite-type tricarboxylate transporter receptor subunit TctC